MVPQEPQQAHLLRQTIGLKDKPTTVHQQAVVNLLPYLGLLDHHARGPGRLHEGLEHLEAPVACRGGVQEEDIHVEATRKDAERSQIAGDLGLGIV